MTNHDDLCENLPRYMFHIDDAGRASMKQDPIGAYIHIADLKQALKLSGSCEGITVEKIRTLMALNCECYPNDEYKMAKAVHEFIHAQMTGGKK